ARNPALIDKEKVAKEVGVGAVIFNDLSSSRIKDIVFTWEDSLNFEGETGPYVQYAHARASNVLKKATQKLGQEGVVLDGGLAMLTDDASIQVIKQLAQFTEKVELAMHKLEPSIISRYAIDLAQSFNQFYH